MNGLTLVAGLPLQNSCHLVATLAVWHQGNSNHLRLQFHLLARISARETCDKQTRCKRALMTTSTSAKTFDVGNELPHVATCSNMATTLLFTVGCCLLQSCWDRHSMKVIMNLVQKSCWHYVLPICTINSRRCSLSVMPIGRTVNKLHFTLQIRSTRQHTYCSQLGDQSPAQAFSDWQAPICAAVPSCTAFAIQADCFCLSACFLFFSIFLSQISCLISCCGAHLFC